MYLKPADGMVNIAGPDQTAPVEAIRYGSALFAYTCLSRYCG